jgi:hypothetical protein
LQKYTQFGLKYKAMGGDIKVKFDSKLKSLHPEDQQIIQARIKKTLETERGQAETETQRAFIRKKNAQTTYKAAAKPKKAPPRVLSEAEIDRRAEELLKLHQQGKKEALNGQRAQLRAVARKDFTKEGLSADRSRAVNYTHAEILQRADELIAEHDTIEAAKSPTDAEAIKAKATAQSEAQKELDAAKEAGATVDLVQDKGIQAPVHAGQLKWEDVDAYLANKVGKQSPVYQIGAKLAEAMKQGKEVTIRYDSERSGDTGQFQRKRVLPTHFDLQKTGDGYKLVMFATNKQGYTSQYYVEPSVPNAKTGTQSLILETPTIHADKQVTVNTVPNVYAGPKAFSPRALLDRPVRQTVGLTSQLRLGLTDADAYSGKAASYVAKQAGKGGYIGKAAKVISAGLEKSEALNVMIDKSYNETMTPEALSAVEESIAHQGKKSKDILADGVNC